MHNLVLGQRGHNGSVAVPAHVLRAVSDARLELHANAEEHDQSSAEEEAAQAQHHLIVRAPHRHAHLRRRLVGVAVNDPLP